MNSLNSEDRKTWSKNSAVLSVNSQKRIMQQICPQLDFNSYNNKSTSTPFSENHDLNTKIIQDKMSRIMKFESTNNQTNQSQPSFYKTVLVFVAVINLGFLGFLFRGYKIPVITKLYNFQMINLTCCIVLLVLQIIRYGVSTNQNHINQYIKISLFFTFYLLGFVAAAELVGLDKLYIFVNYDLSFKILLKMVSRLKGNDRSIKSNKHEKISTSLLMLYLLANLSDGVQGLVLAMFTAFSYYKYDQHINELNDQIDMLSLFLINLFSYILVFLMMLAANLVGMQDYELWFASLEGLANSVTIYLVVGLMGILILQWQIKNSSISLFLLKMQVISGIVISVLMDSQLQFRLDQLLVLLIMMYQVYGYQKNQQKQNMLESNNIYELFSHSSQISSEK